jgi:hypothetical protein
MMAGKSPRVARRKISATLGAQIFTRSAATQLSGSFQIT